MNENVVKWVRLAGITMLILANACFALLGDTTVSRLISQQCELYLLNGDEFSVPPLNCIDELKFLKKRVEKKINEYNNNDSINVDVPPNVKTDHSNS
jgi:hypothetical protein